MFSSVTCVWVWFITNATIEVDGWAPKAGARFDLSASIIRFCLCGCVSCMLLCGGNKWMHIGCDFFFMFH